MTKEFVVGKRGLFGPQLRLPAVNNVSFHIDQGETLGLVGESGCGKTTTGRLSIRLLEPTSGKVFFDGHNILADSPAKLRDRRRDMQIIFQDPLGALNPRMTVGELIVEPLVIHAVGDSTSREARLRKLLGLVGLASYHAGRFPHEFSGGQRQRICIARALALNPRFIVCDEVVSALDVSIQAQILNLLKDLKQQLGLTYLFISHDLGVIRYISDRIAVMYLGKIVEIAPRSNIFDAPLHPYTIALLNAAPASRLNQSQQRQRRKTISGDVPNPINPPSGCSFNTRCSMVQPICRSTAPPLRELDKGHYVACHFSENMMDNRYTPESAHEQTS